MKGETVTRADLCEAVHEEVGLTRQDCGELVERVLELMADGCSTREIAVRMSYSERTIKKVITNLHCSLAARNRAQVVAQAIRRGLL